MAPSLVLGLALGRIGCLLNGCCYGGLCDASWAVTFPSTSEPYTHQRMLGQLHGFLLAQDADSSAACVAAVQLDGPAAEAGLQVGDVLRAIAGRPVETFGEAQIDRIDYVAVVDPDTLEPVVALSGPSVMLIAAHVGGTRLIDNWKI